MQYQWKYVVDADAHQWVLKRNCALTPRQLGGWFGSLALVSLLLAAVFAARGAWLVFPFSLVEICALGYAFVWWSRHAGDYERIVITADLLSVETSSGQRVQRVEHRPAWARVEYDGARREPIRIVAGGDSIDVGNFVPEDRRGALARELRGVLASCSASLDARG
jgi:uncharacterized membrane protein